MPKRVIDFFTFQTDKLNWRSVFWFLFFIALFVRFPFFFRDYVDRDESTFIIMAQSWVDGYLPYTKLWDLKPPITFLVFAGIISVFGKSFLAIRLIGTLMVVLTSLFAYGIASRITSRKVAFWCAVFCVFFQSLFGSLQGVMSEHICTLFFVIAVYLLLSKDKWWWYMIIGLLLGLSVMSKLNMAYPLFTLGLFLFWKALVGGKFWSDIRNLVLMAIGFILLVFLTAFPYHLQGELQVWWESIFEAPLAYSQSKFHSIGKALPLVLVVTVLIALGSVKKLIDISSKEIQILIVVIVGVLASFLQTGKVNGHYLIQLYPFVLILVGIAISKLPPLGKGLKTVAAVLLVLIPMESYLEYANIVKNKSVKSSFFNGEGIDVPKYILENQMDTQNIFFTEYHIGYWVLGVDPPTKVATHPSNITRDKLFPYMNNPRTTGMEELEYIMEEIRPKVVVARKGKKIFDKKLLDYNTYIDAYLNQHYKLIKTIDRGLIYQRLE
ncbi:ArnT family glycosyltransferase [Flagellimonas myxillae]|uniref:ArnT family glycosyltransferase n=1 Tax=Flagellimonas myxillae TaxID=2942214 RepID=UPI00201F525A|nr:glycosyltransferase family 39 protein [Muricauda myxillae]MCL6267488.1 glycosyltransferase family 39 protein [Muricauda myxillae]